MHSSAGEHLRRASPQLPRHSSANCIGPRSSSPFSDVDHSCADTGLTGQVRRAYSLPLTFQRSNLRNRNCQTPFHFEVHEAFITWLKSKANFQYAYAQSEVVCGLITVCNSPSNNPVQNQQRAHSQWVCNSHFNVGQTNSKLLYLLKYSKCPPCIKSHTSVINCIYQKLEEFSMDEHRGRSPMVDTQRHRGELGSLHSSAKCRFPGRWSRV